MQYNGEIGLRVNFQSVLASLIHSQQPTSQFLQLHIFFISHDAMFWCLILFWMTFLSHFAFVFISFFLIWWCRFTYFPCILVFPQFLPSYTLHCPFNPPLFFCIPNVLIVPSFAHSLCSSHFHKTYLTCCCTSHILSGSFIQFIYEPQVGSHPPVYIHSGLHGNSPMLHLSASIFSSGLPFVCGFITSIIRLDRSGSLSSSIHIQDIHFTQNYQSGNVVALNKDKIFRQRERKLYEPHHYSRQC